MADLVIRGGNVIDGTGAPGRFADVAIEGDRIAEIGSGLTDRLTADAPEGMRHVLVNGAAIRSEGTANLELQPGRAVTQGFHR
jgi:N-acyl-D-aspartate/D-glutamate deacylase